MVRRASRNGRTASGNGGSGRGGFDGVGPVPRPDRSSSRRAHRSAAPIPNTAVRAVVPTADTPVIGSQGRPGAPAADFAAGGPLRERHGRPDDAHALVAARAAELIVSNRGDRELDGLVPAARPARPLETGIEVCAGGGP